MDRSGPGRQGEPGVLRWERELEASAAPPSLATVGPSCALTTFHLAPTAQSMFQIPEFEPSEQEDSSPADRGLGPSPTGDQPPGPGKHRQTAPGLLGEAAQPQGQPASSNHHGGRYPPPQPPACPSCPQPSSFPHPSCIPTHWLASSKCLTSLHLSFLFCKTEQLITTIVGLLG